jgi:hypothetical protein
MRSTATPPGIQGVTVHFTTSLYGLLACLQEAIGEDDEAVVAAALRALRVGRGAFVNPTVGNDVLHLVGEEAV